ncbi:hypothetical protein ACHAXH_000500, partial [Discostella pseudostelligera]
MLDGSRDGLKWVMVHRICKIIIINGIGLLNVIRIIALTLMRGHERAHWKACLKGHGS